MHHLISRLANGQFHLNGELCPGCTSLDEVGAAAATIVCTMRAQRDHPRALRCSHAHAFTALHGFFRQVVSYLGQARPVPLNWRAALQLCPEDMDRLLSPTTATTGQAAEAPALLPRQQSVRSIASSSLQMPSVAKTFSATIHATPASRLLHFTASAGCLLRMSAETITLVDRETRGDIAIWKLAALDW